MIPMIIIGLLFVVALGLLIWGDGQEIKEAHEAHKTGKREEGEMSREIYTIEIRLLVKKPSVERKIRRKVRRTIRNSYCFDKLLMELAKSSAFIEEVTTSIKPEGW